MLRSITTALALVVLALLVIGTASVSAGDGNGSGDSSNAGRKATRTPTRTRTATNGPTNTSTPLGTHTPAPTSVPTDTPTITPPPATHTATSTPTPDGGPAQREQETVDLINQRRAAISLPTLRVDAALVSAARRHSRDIGPLGLCQHNGTDGSSPWSRIAEAGYAGNALGEVVACGFSYPVGVVNAWWNSPGHYAVLTDPNANDIGCGWWISPQGYGWVTCDTGNSSR